MVDNTHSTYGATLSDNVFYIQRSCIEDLLGYHVRVEEIYNGIKNKDYKICVPLFRIIIHEIGAAFFKLSHPANQEIEKLFLSSLSKTNFKPSSTIQEEISNVNNTVDLNTLSRMDWAQKRAVNEFQLAEEININNLFSLAQKLPGQLINTLYDPNRKIEDGAAILLAELKCVEALPYLKLALMKAPKDEFLSNAISVLEKIKKEISSLKTMSRISERLIKESISIVGPFPKDIQLRSIKEDKLVIIGFARTIEQSI